MQVLWAALREAGACWDSMGAGQLCLWRHCASTLSPVGVGKLRPRLCSQVLLFWGGPIQLLFWTPSQEAFLVSAECLHIWKPELKWSLGPGLGKAANNSVCFGCEAYK